MISDEKSGPATAMWQYNKTERDGEREKSQTDSKLLTFLLVADELTLFNVLLVELLEMIDFEIKVI